MTEGTAGQLADWKSVFASIESCRFERTYEVAEEMKRLALIFFMSAAQLLAATPSRYSLSLEDAETKALESSWRLKASTADVEATLAQQKAAFTQMLPRLFLQGSYTYLSTLPEVSFGGGPAMTFGAHHNFSLGPALSFTLWDTFSGYKSYEATRKLRQSREQDNVSARNQVLFAIRTAYLKAQLALEELRLVNGSYELALAQRKDVSNRFSAGAATRLDLGVTKRHVIGFQLQFEQKQADLALALQELAALTGDKSFGDGLLPGPSNVPGVTLVVELDPLSKTLAQLSQNNIIAPDDTQPQVQSKVLLAQSLERNAAALRAKLFPVIQLTASTTVANPNGPQIVTYNQNTIGLTLTMPLFIGDPTWHLVEQKNSESRAAQYAARQTRSDLDRDYAKALEVIESLHRQRELAKQDVHESTDVARLYYGSYQAGKTNLIDVQSANNQSLQAQVNAARLDAQLISQLIYLFAITGKDPKDIDHG